VVYTSSYQTLEEQIYGNLRSYAGNALDAIDRLLFERIADMEVLATDTVFSAPDIKPEQVTTRLIEYRNRHKAYASLAFYDLNRIRIADTSGLGLGQPFAHASLWEDALREGASNCRVSMSESLRTPVVHFARLVKDDQGNALGVITADMPITKLNSVVDAEHCLHSNDNEAAQCCQEEIDLFAGDGLLLYSNYNRKGILKDNLFKNDKFTELSTANREGILYDPFMDNEKDLYVHVYQQGYLDFEGNNWSLAACVPEKIALAPVYRLRKKLASILAGALVIVVIISLFFSRTLSRPIIELRDAAAEMGQGRLDQRIAVASKDEIGQLAISFNTMAKTLSESMDSLQREIMVRERAEDNLADLNQELRQTVDKLSFSNRELQDFVYVASHDLREPLRKISSFGGLLKESLLEGMAEDDQENLDFMIDGANRMTQMIEALLLYSRTNTKEMQFETIDLNETIQQLEQLELGTLIEETQAIIEVPQCLPQVKADAVQIRQLLQNLLANSIKYRRAGTAPHIVISAQSTEGDTVRINVQDNGIGIKEALHESVFKMFKRVHSRQQYEGAGIGLAVCRKIVDRHAGRIGVESREGQGSVFWFTLPVAQDAFVMS